MIRSKPTFVMYRIALFLFLGFTILFLSACDILDDDSDSGGEVKPFYLVDSIDQLTDRYRDCSVGAVVSLSFNKAVNTVSDGDDSPRSTKDSIEECGVAGGLLKVFERDTLREVEGDVYASADRRELTFVPRELLLPDTDYRVLLSSLTKSVDDEYLDRNYTFELKTRESDDVVTVVTDRDVIVEGSPVNFSADSPISFERLEWTFNCDDANSPSSNLLSPAHVYDAPGTYEVSLAVEDLYGRHFSAGTQIRVYPDIEAKLKEKDAFYDVRALASNEIADGILAGIIETYGYEVLSAAEADLSCTLATDRSLRAEPSLLSLSEVLPRNPLLSFSVRPESVAQFVSDYIQALIDEGRFLGIVSFKGFPAVLSSVSFNDYFVLELLVCEGPLDIQYRDERFDIDLSISGMNPTPALHKVSIPVSAEVVNNLRDSLPSTIRKPLPVFYTSKGSYMLDILEEPYKRSATARTMDSRFSIGGSINLGIVSVSVSVGTEGVSGDIDVDDGLEAIYDFLTDDLVNLLTGVKSFVTEVISLNPFGYLSDVRDDCADIKNQCASLYDAFRDPGDVISNVTDPALMVADMRNFLYANGETSVKTVAEGALNVLNHAGGAFQLISDPLLSVTDTGSYLLEFIPSSDTNAHIVFHAGTDEFSLKVKAGAASQTLALDTLNTVSDYAGTVLDALGADFPLSDIIEKLELLQDVYGTAMSGEVGYYYTGSMQELKFVYTVTAGDSDLYRLRVMLSPADSKLDVKVTNPLAADTWVLLEYDPFPISVTDSTVDLMFDMLAYAASPFPDVTLTIQTRYRDILASVTSRLRPAYSFSAYVNLGVEVDYYIGIGGKGEVGIQIYLGIDGSAIAGETLKDAAKSAFVAGRDSFSEYFSTVTDETGSHGVMNFPDEEQFIEFMYSFLGNLRDELIAKGVAESLLSAVTVGISPSAEIGIGLGAGGTGTGGGAANLSLGTAFDVNANLLFFYETLLGYYRDENISTFLLTPLLQTMQSMSPDMRSNPFDVKSTVKLFEQGFSEIIGQVPAESETETAKYNAIDTLFHSMADNVNFGLSFQAGIDGELEEAANLEAGFTFGPSVSANGEFVFNTLYPAMDKAFEVAGMSQTVRDRLIVLDQPGIFPEISFTIPLNGNIEAGFDEAVQINLGLGAQMNFIEGTLTMQGDPFRTAAEGGLAGGKTILSYPVVMVTQFPGTASRGVGVTISASQSVFQTGTTAADVTWFLNGQEIEGTGAITENDEVIADVTTTDFDMAITLIPQRMMEYRLRCEIEDSEGRSDFDYLIFTPVNQLPGQPILTLLDNAGLSRIDRIPVAAVDPDGDPLIIEVAIASDAGFADVLFNYTLSGNEISLPASIIEGNSYYIRVRAYDGFDYGPWSTVRHFTVVALPVSLSTPPEGQTFIYGGQTTIAFEWDSDADYLEYRFQLADKPSFTSPLIDEFTGIQLYEVSGADLEGLAPDVYYWRVAGYNLQANTLDWGESWSFAMRPQPTVLYDPAHLANISHTQQVLFEVEDPGDVDSFEFQYSTSSTFQSGNGGITTTASVWQTGPLPGGTWYWRARTWANGVESVWSAARIFHVTNTAPSKVVLTDYQKDPCIDGMLALIFNSVDSDGDTLTYLVYLREGGDGGGTYDLLKSYSVVTPQITFDLTEGGYDFYVDIQAMDALGALSPSWDKEEMLHVVTGNCPPMPPNVLAPAEGCEVIRDNVTLEVQAVTDPDGDQIDHYEFVIFGGEAGERQENSVLPSLWIGDLERGEYSWKARAVSGVGADLKESGYSEERRFSVLDNQPPETVNDSPAAGSVFSSVNWITLSSQAADDEEDDIPFYGFELADSDAFDTVIVHFKDIPGSSVDVGMQLPAGVYYWRARAADFGGYGEFSDPFCFSVINAVDVPNIVDAGNETEFVRDSFGRVSLVFEATTYTTDCLGRFTGTLEYELRNDQDNLIAPIGTFESGVPFDLLLPAGNYFWRARHIVAGLASDWSDPFAITVLEGNRRPVAENITPAGGAIFNTGDEIILTLRAVDPDEDPIRSYDFQCDQDSLFSEPLERLDQPTDTANMGTLTPGIYYWRGKASDEEGYGDWSTPTCFSVIETVAAPDIAGAGNVSEFSYDGEGAYVTFRANSVTVTCTGGFAGTFTCEVADNDAFTDAVTGSFENDVPFFLFLEPGIYYWRARHVIAGIESDPSTALQFEVSPENQLPTAENVTPDGDVYPYENQITLLLSASDPNGNEEIQSYDFEYDVSMNFDYDPQRIYGVAENSTVIVPPALSEDTYYWRGRAYDAEGHGDWSSATCFTVIESVNAPVISDAGNASEYEGDGERVTLTFYVREEFLTTHCKHEPVGTLFYEISADPDFLVTAADGNFESGVSFTEWLSPGTYYWRAQHIVSGLESEWSGSLEFTVTGETQELLLIDEDFEEGIADWTQVKSGTGNFILEAISDGGNSLFHYQRYNAGSSGGEAGLQQVLNTGITSYSEVYIEFDLKLMGYSLSDSGQWTYQNGGTGEWPADVKIYFTDLDENNHIWNNGFLNGADFYNRTNYTSIGLNTWYHYRSPNLRTVKTTRTGPGNTPVQSNFIYSINTMRIGGGGWDFEGAFDNVKLILIE